ncbi:MAG: cytidine deaminase [Saprospiraceae bacterium]|nr:cytidine deaminase [Saprospiraceae bacterium]MCF8248888.1 cytidine deaminase [Saprospiraceae bacterium]MCF8279613.1 cytidine deaminase [Bacteroidales bacterium]MCF8310173.1 cytidine deaminase [Saprospiraceae bacterium]MCF8439073.1 cytidine deaminase [Saprospiraceae bacterium]
MEKLSIRTEFTSYGTLEELLESDRELLLLAKKSLENSYSPYSNFKVGAAVLLRNGQLIGGSNYENASYPLCICAEQTVLTTAANLHPGVAPLALAIAIRNPRQVINRPGLPCGACRQVICETEMKNKQPMRVILQGETGPIFIFEKGIDLLPLAFDQTFL